MDCEICGSKVGIINNTYVCEEGHISNNKIEVIDDTSAVPLLSVPREEKAAVVSAKYSFEYMKLLILHLLFEEVKVHLGIKSSKYFEIFVNFFREDETKTLYGPSMSLPTLKTLAYYSKRIEVEAENKTYLFLEFHKEMESYPLRDKFGDKIKLFNMNKKQCFSSFLANVQEWSSNNIYTRLKILGEDGLELFRNKKSNVVHNETGIEEEEIRNNRICFRQDLRRDYCMFFEYLKRICEIFMLDITEDLEEKFKFFFYASDFTQTIHMPEVELAPFLYIYIMNHRRDFDVERAIRNFRKVFNGFYGENWIQEHKDIDLAVLDDYDSQNTFQTNVKFLLTSISWLKYIEFRDKVRAVKKLLCQCISRDAFRGHWKREREMLKRNFDRSAWYIKKLIYERKNL